MKLEIVLLMSVVWGAVGFSIGKPRGYPIAGPLLGFLFGPLGLLLLIVSTKKLVPCPFCCQKIKKGATVCNHCGQSLLMHAP